MRIGKIIGVLLVPVLVSACVAVNPGQTRNEKASAVNVQLGIGYLQQNNLDLASEKLNKALRQNPDSASAHNAYAILQDRLKQTDKAAYHYRRATTLDPSDSQAANNYGAFLCRNGRELESEEYFLRAVKNPLYNTPEYAYTNAAVCLLRVNNKKPAREYLSKAIAAKSDFGPALVTMSDLLFTAGEYDNVKIYIDRYHLVAEPTPRSLWLAIRNALHLDSDGDVDELVQRLSTDFPNSEEYQSWLAIQ